MTDDRQRAREVLDHAARGLTYGPATTGAVPYGIAIEAMIAFAAPPEAGVEIPVGMKPWGGGPKPADWSGEAVMFRSGQVKQAPVGAVWKLGWDHSYGEGDIIAYTPKPAPAIPADDALRENVGKLHWRNRITDCAARLKRVEQGERLAAVYDGKSEEKRAYQIRADLGVLLAALSTPTPAARPDVVEAAQFLCDRLDQLEWMDGDLENTCRDYFGHVDPAHHRLKQSLASLPDITKKDN